MPDDEDDFGCGESVQDHEQETVYEDDEIWQGTCTRCGAELWEDKSKEEVAP